MMRIYLSLSVYANRGLTTFLSLLFTDNNIVSNTLEDLALPQI